MFYESPHAKFEMGKEAFMAEQTRWNNLTDEERAKELEELSAARREESRKRLEKKKEEQYKRNLQGAEHTYVYTDTVNTIENSEATVIWLIVMVVGAIFKDRLLIWVVATAIWWCFINRYKIRKHKWDNGGKEEYLKKLDETFKNIGGKKDE